MSRRAFLGAAGGLAIGAAAATTGFELSGEGPPQAAAAPVAASVVRAADQVAEPFYGLHQGGVSTVPQSHTYFAAFDLQTGERSEVVALLKDWTGTAASLAAGGTAGALTGDTGAVQPDSAEALGIGPARLTINFDVGPGLFSKDGSDRYGLAHRRPPALVDLPRFPGDQLIATKVGGDLTVQACADDPQVAFHAVRQLARVAGTAAAIVWTQGGYNETPATGGTPRNLMGFKDGTINPQGAQFDDFVWVGAEGPSWMRGGTYVVFRRIRISLEHWDSKSLGTQEQVIGRYKVSGAPLGEKAEFDPLDLAAKDPSGNPVIPIDSHVRLSAPALNGGQMILRRGYAYNDGVDPFVERWPPWKQALMYDAGLLFCAYQRDPRKGFIPIFQNLAENDALGEFTTHTGSAIAAIPPAARAPGSWIGEDLFET